MMDAMGGRKVAIAAAVIALGVGAVFLRGDIPAGFLTLLQTVFGAFVVGNVAAKFSPEARAYVESSGEESVYVNPVPPILDDFTSGESAAREVQSIERIELKLDATQASLSQVQETLMYIIKRAFPDVGGK